MMSSRTGFRTMLAWSWKEIVHGQLWPVTVSLTLIVASIFALTAMAERLEQVVVKKGKEALSADSVFISANPPPKALMKPLLPGKLERAALTRFNTMAFSSTDMQLVTVKAVDSAYPLLGQLKLVQGERQFHHVSAGQLWLEPRVMERLNVAAGDTLSIGDADFTVSGQITDEPGLSFNPFQQMPTVIIHQSDITKTGAIQTGSRVRYSVFFAGDNALIDKLKQTIPIQASDRWRDTSSQSRTNEIFQRTEQYLSLTVAIVVIMAATTLVLTCQHYVASRNKTVAMLKSLGASKRWIATWLSIQILILFIGSLVAGILIGIVIEYLLRIPIKEILPDALPSYGWKPAIWASVSSFLIALPSLGIPLLRLLNVSAAEAIQPQAKKRITPASLLLIACPLVALIAVYHSNLLVWVVLAGIVGLFFVLGAVSMLLSVFLAKLPLSVSFRLAFNRMNRSRFVTCIQFSALALSLMMLGVIWLVRTDLLADWNRVLPKNAPNAFAFNISPSELKPYLETLDGASLERSPAYPIIRGRLVAVNGVDAKNLTYDKDSTDALRRELNFTWATHNPSYNKLLVGKWTEKDGVSVESEVANSLGIQIGDQLTFSINSQDFNAIVNSIRQVEWRDMKPNFYFIFTPDVLENVPMTWLVSFRIGAQDDPLINRLSRQHPTVSLMDIRVMGEKIRQLLSQIVLAITGLASLGVIAGILLIYTLLKLSLSTRHEEIRLYRTLGASRKRVQRTLWAEFGILGLISGLVATLATELVVYGIMRIGFEIIPSLHYAFWFSLPLMTISVLFLVIYGQLNRLLVPHSKQYGS